MTHFFSIFHNRDSQNDFTIIDNINNIFICFIKFILIFRTFYSVFCSFFYRRFIVKYKTSSAQYQYVINHNNINRIIIIVVVVIGIWYRLSTLLFFRQTVVDCAPKRTDGRKNILVSAAIESIVTSVHQNGVLYTTRGATRMSKSSYCTLCYVIITRRIADEAFYLYSLHTSLVS